MAEANIGQDIIDTFSIFVEGVVERAYFTNEISAPGNESSARFDFADDVSLEMIL